MGKISKRIWIAVFIAALTVPKLSWPFLKKYVDTGNYENRELAIKPDLSAVSLTEYPDAYEAWFNDWLPYKNQLQFANRAVDFLVFHSLDSDQVLLGKDEWLFYKAAGCIDSYRGLVSYSEDELREMADNLLVARQWFDERGIKLVINIVPNKEEVYCKYMPDDIQVVNPVSQSQQAVEYLSENTDLDVLYELERLQSAAERQQVYYKYDTHWNYVGGYYGAQSVLERVGAQMPDCTEDMIVPWAEDVFEPAPQQKGTTFDLAMMAGLPHLLDVKRDKRFMVNYKPEVNFTYESLAEYSDIDTMLYSSNAQDSRRVIMICDSFGNLDMPYIAKEFAESACIHYAHYTAGFMGTYPPDIVVFQFVERQAGRFDQTILNVIQTEEAQM